MNLDLIDLSGDLRLIASKIRSSPRAIGRYYLSSKALIDLLERIKIGEVDRELVVVISDLLEANDLIEVEQGKEGAVADVLFFLSNPEINGYPDSLEISRLISLLTEKH
jgi:hypothetical protein